MLRLVPGAPISTDLTLTAEYKKRFEFGTNYRYDESISGIANFVFEDFLKIGFIYEYTTTDVADFQNGTFELFVKFLVGKKQELVNIV